MRNCVWGRRGLSPAMLPRLLQLQGGAFHRVSSHRRAVSGDSQPPLPSQAKVVICGGGIVGTSVAYHLAKLGWNDILLLEQGR